MPFLHLLSAPTRVPPPSTHIPVHPRRTISVRGTGCRKCTYLENKYSAQTESHNNVPRRKYTHSFHSVFSGIDIQYRVNDSAQCGNDDRNVHRKTENVCRCPQNRKRWLITFEEIYAPRLDPSKNIALSFHLCSLATRPTRPTPAKPCNNAYPCINIDI